MRYAAPSLALLSILLSVLSAPAPVGAPKLTPTSLSEDSAEVLEERQLLSGLSGGVTGLLDDVDRAVAAKDPAAINSALVRIKPANRPINVAEAQTRASKIWAPSGRADLYGAIATQVASGLGPLLDGTLQAALTGGLPVGDNSIDNNHPKPKTVIHPQKDVEDAPYSLSEDELRKAIFIPPGFSYGSGSKRPVIMVPGTGSYGGINFANNLRKSLSGQSFADPVWLNVPGAMVGNTQVNSEYLAYAINYISAVSDVKNKENLAIISWSQGGLDTQWVFKYWPSTRKVVKDFLPVSADFKGSTVANAVCLSPGGESLNPLCPPSFTQQRATATYVKTLRLNGGDSAYVPTTSFFSGFFDEVVQPQQGVGASAYLLSNNDVAAMNYDVQKVCAGKLAGGFYGHAGALAHPLTYALIVDALTHDGPGRLDRIDVDDVCNNLIAPGLDLDDYLATVALIPIAIVQLLAYPEKTSIEPALKAYALY